MTWLDAYIEHAAERIVLLADEFGVRAVQSLLDEHDAVHITAVSAVIL